MHFKNNGYSTVSLGKIYHHSTDGKGSWDRVWNPKASKSKSWMDYLTDVNLMLDKSGKERGLPYEKTDVDDAAYKMVKRPFKP